MKFNSFKVGDKVRDITESAQMLEIGTGVVRKITNDIVYVFFPNSKCNIINHLTYDKYFIKDLVLIKIKVGHPKTNLFKTLKS